MKPFILELEHGRYRKRMLGGSSAMLDTMRHFYTEGERAVGCVVAGEVKRRGYCDLSIGELADRAGVARRLLAASAGRTSVRRPRCGQRATTTSSGYTTAALTRSLVLSRSGASMISVKETSDSRRRNGGLLVVLGCFARQLIAIIPATGAVRSRDANHAFQGGSKPNTP